MRSKLLKNQLEEAEAKTVALKKKAMEWQEKYDKMKTKANELADKFNKSRDKDGPFIQDFQASIIERSQSGEVEAQDYRVSRASKNSS